MSDLRELHLVVVGAGKVGMSIIQAFAQSGFHVLGVDIDKVSIDSGLQRVEYNLSSLVAKGKLSGGDKDAILSRMTFTNDFGRLRDAEVVIEAIFEDMGAKKELFGKLDQLVASPESLLLSNTSSLSISEIASGTRRPEMVAGMHFFNPVPVMKLVEVVRGTLTSDQTVARVRELAVAMGKTPIVSADSPAFIVNRMLNALACEAARIVAEGVGSVEDVDTGARLGLGHPMGPFELFDYLNAIGLLCHVTDYMAEELGERFKMPVWVKNLARAGRNGRASGGGFYRRSAREAG